MQSSALDCQYHTAGQTATGSILQTSVISVQASTWSPECYRIDFSHAMPFWIAKYNVSLDYFFNSASSVDAGGTGRNQKLVLKWV